MHRSLRFLVGLVAVPFVAMLLFGAGGSTTQSDSFQYLLPPGALIEDAEGHQHHTVPVRARPCDVSPCVADDVVVGNPVVLIREPVHELEVRFDDDRYGDRVPVTVCMRDEFGFCTEASFGPICGPFAVAVLPRPAVTAVHAYSLVVSDDLSMCGATKGTVHVAWG